MNEQSGSNYSTDSGKFTKAIHPTHRPEMILTDSEKKKRTNRMKGNSVNDTSKLTSPILCRFISTRFYTYRKPASRRTRLLYTPLTKYFTPAQIITLFIPHHALKYKGSSNSVKK